MDSKQMKYKLLWKKADIKSDVKPSDDSPPVLFELSSNLIHTYGKCRQRKHLSERIKVSTVDVCNGHFRRILEQSDDYQPKDTNQFAKYLDLISNEELKDKPLSRLQSRYPLRRISRVSLRPKPTDKVDIKSMDLSSHLRRVCLKGVETLNRSDIESNLSKTEIYCKTPDINSNYNFSQNITENTAICQTNELVSSDTNTDTDTGDTDLNSNDSRISGRICSLVLPKLTVCPICEDTLFNRSRKNTKKRRYHSCIKGIVKNQLTEDFSKFCI